MGKVVFTGGSYEVGTIYGIVPYRTGLYNFKYTRFRKLMFYYYLYVIEHECSIIVLERKCFIIM